MYKINNAYCYQIDKDYLETRGEKLCELINSWLKENKLDATSYKIILADDLSELIVDYEYDIANAERIKKLVEMVFDRFNIIYKLAD